MPTNRDLRLSGELRKMERLVSHSSFITFEALTRPDDLEGKYPEKYEVTFTCKALIANPGMPSVLTGKIPEQCVGECHQAEIQLSGQFPDVPPEVRFKTPIFHPNIASRSRMQEEKERRLKELNVSEEQLAKVNPEMAEKFDQQFSGLPICLDGLRTPKDGGIFRAKLTLDKICTEIARMITYQNYRLFDDQGKPDVYNGEALSWTIGAEKQSGILPIDDREILDKRQRPLREKEADIEITIEDIEAMEIL